MSGGLVVRAPFDGAVLGEVPFSDAAALEAALKGASARHAARERWPSPSQRVAVLRRAAGLLETRAEELALLAAREGGKPLTDSRVEVARAINGLHLAAEAVRASAGRMVPMELDAASSGRVAFTQLEPMGPVLAISAFNHPLNNVVHQVAPAIAAGCPVLLKPAPSTPLTALAFVKLLREAGLAEGECQVLLPSDEAGIQRLASDRRLAFVSFIGSGEVGWKLRAQVAPGVRVALELGGVAPVLVDGDVELEDVVARLTKGGFTHAGQVCVSVQRVFAHPRVARPLAERLAQAARALRVGDPTLAETQVGPMIRPAAIARVDAWVQEAQAAGAELLCGGERLGTSCYAPTVLWNPPPNARVSAEEVFGPVVCVYPCADLDEAADRANAVPYAFQAAVFAGSVDAAMGAVRRLRAAAVMVNDHPAFRVDWMPFGGIGISGLGAGSIQETMREMQVEKLVVVRSDRLAGA